MMEILVGDDQKQQRLDRFLKKYLPKASLSHIYKIIRKDTKVNGKRVKPDTMLAFNDRITLYLSEEEIRQMGEVKKRIPVKKQFDILYEDENILAVNKPKGLLTHGDKTEKKCTLVNQVIDYLVEKGDYVFSRENTFTPAPANRLDRNTSGIVLFGKNNAALQELNRMIKQKGCVRKMYLAAAEGELRQAVTLTGVMVKDEKKNKITVREDGEGKPIETVLRPIRVKNGYCLVEAELITGRTHQIRAHMASRGLYIIGDAKYGSEKTNRMVQQKFQLGSQFLHAYKLEFCKCGQLLSDLQGRVLTAPLPPILERIKQEMFGEE